ncbi:MAG: photosynthetic complex assembly protein PuhC [Pseudomonadota bacterium]
MPQTRLYVNAETGQSRAQDTEVIPTRLVFAMFGFALLTLLFVGWSVASDRPHVGVPKAAPILAQHSVTIAGEGRAAIVTAEDGTVLLDTPTGGFITVVRDGLERARFNHRIAGNAPVVVTRYANGRLQLSDPETGWEVELSSFGAGNANQFARILPHEQ